MAVGQSKILLQGAQEFAASAQNDCILQVLYRPLVVCFVHLCVSLISQKTYLIHSSLVAAQLLNAQHESLGFVRFSPSQCARKGINRIGVLRIERDSPPPR